MKVTIGELIGAIIGICFIIGILLGLIHSINMYYTIDIFSVEQKREFVGGIILPSLLLLFTIIAVIIEYGDKEIDFSKIINKFKNIKL